MYKSGLSWYSSLMAKETEPYIIRTVELWVWNPDFPALTPCKCGHPYYRHFDSYDDMEAVGCKYCPCYTFETKETP